MPQVVVYISVQHWYTLHALFLLHASTSRISSCPPKQSLTFLPQEFPLNCENDNRQFHKNWLTRLSNRYIHILKCEFFWWWIRLQIISCLRDSNSDLQSTNPTLNLVLRLWLPFLYKLPTCWTVFYTLELSMRRVSWSNGSAPYRKFKLQTSNNWNTKCYMKFPKHELPVHGNNVGPVNILKMWDQMPTTLFSILPLTGQANKFIKTSKLYPDL
jgi:hypothetical protein